jgi:hypothetical protein
MTSEGGGKLPSVDHGRRTDRGRDKNATAKKGLYFIFKSFCPEEILLY